MRKHCELGSTVLETLPSLADVALAVRHHHEWFDGSSHGYPDRIAGDRIPLASRIIAVADALDAMTVHGAARRVRSPADARERLGAGRGSQFDPQIVDLPLRLEEPLTGARARRGLRSVPGSRR